MLEFGPFQIDVAARLLMRMGEPVALTPKAFDTLLALVESDGEIVDKETLIRRIWPDTAVEENNLTQNISKLRKALDDDRVAHRYIVTIPRRGYKFVARVRHLRAGGRNGWQRTPSYAAGDGHQTQSAAYNTLGDCLRAAGKPKEALDAYLHTDILYARDKEQHPRALAHISQLWRTLKRDDRADEVWQQLKKDYPNSKWLSAARSSTAP